MIGRIWYFFKTSFNSCLVSKKRTAIFLALILLFAIIIGLVNVPYSWGIAVIGYVFYVSYGMQFAGELIGGREFLPKFNFKAIPIGIKALIVLWIYGTLQALILLGMFIYVNRKKRQLTMTRNELAEANDELASLNTQLKENNGKLNDTNAQLSEANGQLQEMNGRLREAIVHLNDSNLVKEEYIGRFLSICSEYIDKLDAYRLKVNRKLKAQQYNDVLRMTSSDQLREDELDELYQNFDTLFLRLRGRWGAECIALVDILRKTVEFKRQHQPTVLGYLGDQVPHWNNIHHWCWFLNHDTPVMTGTERIAIKNRQAIFFLEMSQKKRGYYEAEFKLITRTPEQLKAFEATDIYHQMLEASIRRQPELWLWSHNRWKRTREEFNERFQVVNGKVVPREGGE